MLSSLIRQAKNKKDQSKPRDKSQLYKIQLMQENGTGLKKMRSQMIDQLNSKFQELEYESNDLNSLEQGKLTKIYEERVLIIDQALGVSTAFAISISFYLFEQQFKIDSISQIQDQNQYDQEVEKLQFYSLISLVITLAIVYLNIQSYRITNIFLIAKKKRFQSSSIMEWQYMKYWLVDSFSYLFAPNPLCDKLKIKFEHEEKEYFYAINNLLIIFQIFRITLIFKALVSSSIYLSNRARRTSDLFNHRITYFFGIKCMFKKMPYRVLITLLVIGMILFSQMIRIAECPLTRPKPYEMENAIWLTYITMTTIGYGDYFAITYLGRFITMIVSLYGNAVISLLIVAFSSDIELDYTENLIYTIYEKTINHATLQRKAGSAIKKFLQFITSLKQKNWQNVDQQQTFELIKNAKMELIDAKSNLRQQNKFLITDLCNNYMHELNNYHSYVLSSIFLEIVFIGVERTQFLEQAKYQKFKSVFQKYICINPSLNISFFSISFLIIQALIFIQLIFLILIKKFQIINLYKIHNLNIIFLKKSTQFIVLFDKYNYFDLIQKRIQQFLKLSSITEDNKIKILFKDMEYIYLEKKKKQEKLIEQLKQKIQSLIKCDLENQL